MKPAVLLIILFAVFQVSHAQEYNPENDVPEHICKYFHPAGEPGVKSVINPNPLVYLYDVKFYKLDLEAYDTTSQFSGFAVVYVQVTASQLDTFSLELHDKLAVDSVFINGTLHSYVHSDDNIYVALSSPAVSGDFLEFTLYYHTPPGYSSIYYSATQHPSYGNFPVSQTFSEPYFAHEWMPVKQELEDKADSVHIFITTDDDLKVAGPGLLTEIPLPDNKVRHEWRTNIPTAFYLIAFAISDYQEYNLWAKPDSLPGDSILIQNYLYDYPGILDDNKTNIDYTAGMIEQLSEQFGLYPFHEEKYGHYMWYPSSFSGMEHITMSGMRNFGFTLISHELGHSWFGDNVTCATWSDIWINEGFATYTQYLIREKFFGKPSADSQMQAYHNYVMSSPGGSVYVPESSLTSWGRIFSTRLSYRKGGALVHMIRYMMNNDSLFFRTCYEFQQAYTDSIATGIDFRNKSQQVSGVDFTAFYDQWYFGEGFPIYDLTWWQQADTVWLAVEQSTSTAVTSFFEIPMEYKLSWTDNDSTFRFEQLQNDTTYKIIIPEEITTVEIDPENWVLNQVNSITHRKLLDLKVFLEGAFDTVAGEMTSGLNPTYIPMDQPYDQSPWNYNGMENIVSPPASMIDWVLIALYDTTGINLATDEALIHRQAALLHNSGNLSGTEGQPFLMFDNHINHNLYVAVYHRNHLPVISAAPITYEKGLFLIDFSNSANQVYGGNDGHKEIVSGTWGMFAGDADANGEINNADESAAWEPEGGTSGYLPSDLNLDGQSDNRDKDDFWFPNNGKASQLPE